MKFFDLKIHCDNAAFEDWQSEVSRILRDLADRLDRDAGRDDAPGGYLLDINGNRVGDWGFDPNYQPE